MKQAKKLLGEQRAQLIPKYRKEAEQEENSKEERGASRWAGEGEEGWNPLLRYGESRYISSTF